jgi:Holliday junction DNA helicase RuvA
MIAHVRGTLAARSKNYAVVDVNGVGYGVYVPDRCLPSGLDMPLTLYTYTSVKEDALELYGFAAPQDREFFKLLISITGIGPKAGLNVLATLDAAQLARAISKGDDKSLTRVPGIGKKMAARIVLELKDKVTKLAMGAGDDGLPPSEAADVLDVLEGLGCAPDAAREVVERVQAEANGKPLGFDDLLAESLQQLALARR